MNVNNKEEIKQRLLSTPIKRVQIDPNGVCNSKCWYCPITYEDYPSHLKSTMPIGMMESIVSQVSNFALKDMNLIWTANYNEVLLYEHFEEMLKIFRKYKYVTMIYTNGTTLTPDKIEIIKRYQDVVECIEINLPAANPEDYSRYTGRNKMVFYKVVNNIRNIIREIPDFIYQSKLGFHTNGFLEENRNEYLGKNAIEIPIDDTNNQYYKLKEMFPVMSSYINLDITDRGGSLKDAGVFDKSSLYPKKDEIVYDCGHSLEQGGRLFGCIHINSIGNLHLCCEEFKCDYSFGNVANDTLKKIWHSDSHVEIIHKALNNICRSCCLSCTKK